MALITRFTRLMKADVNALLDRIEEPDLVLRQAVRDMQEEHDAKARVIQRRLDQIQSQISRITLIEQTLKDIEPQLDDCFAAEREDLARELVQRRLELQASLERQTLRLNSNRTELDRLENKQQDNAMHLQSMRQKLDVLTDDSHHVCDSLGKTTSSDVTQTDVDIAFVQEKQRRSQS